MGPEWPRSSPRERFDEGGCRDKVGEQGTDPEGCSMTQRVDEAGDQDRTAHSSA
jgi:hypothetical protein